jgi:hypothetical protein
MIPIGYTKPTGVPEYATGFEYPIPGTNAGDPQAFIDQEVAQANREGPDKINAYRLARWTEAVTNWMGPATAAMAAGQPLPPKPVQYTTLVLKTQKEDRQNDTAIMWVWQQENGPLGDPCPDPEAPPPPNHPSISNPALDNNGQPFCWNADRFDTVLWYLTVTVIDSGTPIGLQQLSRFDLPPGQYIKRPAMFSEANPKGQYFKL